MTDKKRIENLVEKQGKPITFGGNLSSLSIKNGWTYEDLELYQELEGGTNITADDFIPGFTVKYPME